MLIKLLLGFAVALFLTYPASVLTTMIEGQSAAAIYSNHLLTSLIAYLLVCLPLASHPGVRRAMGYFWKDAIATLQHDKRWVPLLLIITIYSLLVFWDLGRADILGDDYDLAYQAYNLQDGIQASRKAYVVSYNTHPPLFMSIKHYWFQLFPNGLETVPAWGYRGMEGIMGIATILAVYALTRNLWAPAILAVNNYMVLIGRVYLREMYLTFFLTLSIYFFQRKNYLITAFLIGCGLLIKTSAIVVLPVYLAILLYRREFKEILKIIGIIFIMYLPVLVYNLLAYVTTGHMDATFSKIFNISHPFLTGSAPPIDNLTNSIKYLIDIYSLPVIIVFVISTVIYLRNIYSHILIFSLLYFVLGGPLREYYLLFMTVPFAILTSRLPKLIVLPLIIFSLWYAIFGQSYARWLYEPVRGWPELSSKVKSFYQPGDCLEKSGGVNDLAMRSYFQTDDTPKKMLIGSNYPHYFKMCDEENNFNRKINIFYNKGKVDYTVL